MRTVDELHAAVRANRGSGDFLTPIEVKLMLDASPCTTCIHIRDGKDHPDYHISFSYCTSPQMDSYWGNSVMVDYLISVCKPPCNFEVYMMKGCKAQETQTIRDL